MTDALQQLIASAAAEVRPRYACDDGEHAWKSEGGRPCPTGCGGCSQAVYVCEACGVTDYGDGPDSPGGSDCRAACGDSMMGWRGGPFDYGGDA